jgi:hypothetical protein
MFTCVMHVTDAATARAFGNAAWAKAFFNPIGAPAPMGEVPLSSLEAPWKHLISLRLKPLRLLA